MVSFILSTSFCITEITPQGDSDRSELPRLYFQCSFTKILKALHTGFNVYKILEERPKALQKVFLFDVDRRQFPNIFFKIHFYILAFSILTIGKHIGMEVNMLSET